MTILISPALATSIFISPGLQEARAVPTRSLGAPLWDLAGAVPSLDLNFAATKNLVDATTGAELVTFTRASSGTYVDSQGVIQIAANDEPRFDHDPTTGESLGLLVEEQRIQILQLTDVLSTQTKTVTAVAHTLSFYGTGTVALSGVHTATVVGTGAYPARTTLTFTPTAGALTLTVTGTVQFGQLEAGAFATSYIPNAGTSQVTRTADIANITGIDTAPWYNHQEGSVFVEASINGKNVSASGVEYPNGILKFAVENAGSVFCRAMSFGTSSTPDVYSFAQRDGVGNRSATNSSYGDMVIGRSYKMAGAYTDSSSEGIILSVDGLPIVRNANPASVPQSTRLLIGRGFNGAIAGTVDPDSMYLNGPIKRLTFWPQRLAEPAIQSLAQ
jgi:hypothetical protein